MRSRAPVIFETVRWFRPRTSHLKVAPAVTKADIVDRIADGTGLTKLETEAVVDGFIITVMEALESGESVELRGFGSFRVRERAARMARNPQTDEPVEVPRQFVPAFKPSRAFRGAVNDAHVAEAEASAKR